MLMASPMSSKVQAVRGTQDMLGESAERFHAVVAAFDRVRRLYAFQHVEVPVFEATEVFARAKFTLLIAALAYAVLVVIALGWRALRR